MAKQTVFGDIYFGVREPSIEEDPRYLRGSTAPMRNGRMMTHDYATTDDGVVAVDNRTPIDDIEPLIEEEDDTRLLKAACIRAAIDGEPWASVASRFGVSRSIVARYGRQACKHLNLPTPRTDATAHRCRVAQIAKSSRY